MKKFDINILSENLKKVNEIDFCFLFCSAEEGIIKKGSDVDVVIYLNIIRYLLMRYVLIVRANFAN